MADLAFPPANLDPEGNEVPGVAEKVVSYQRDSCHKDDPAFRHRFGKSEEARLMYGSEPYTGAPADSPLPFFEPLDVEDDRIILANRNEMAPLLDSAISRLIGSTAEPEVIPDKATTVVHRAAKKAKIVLDDILEVNRWLPKHHQDAKNAKLDGTSWILAGWESDYMEMKKGPAMVHSCANPVCGIDPKTGIKKPWTMVVKGGEEQEGGGYRYSGKLAREMMEAGIGSSVSEVTDENVFSTLHSCPECEGSLTQRRAMPTDGEMDAFGYEMTEETPLPKAFVQVLPDIEVFPIGNGRTFDNFMPEVTIESIVPKDWLIQRYEHAGEVEAVSLNSIEEIARYHPAGMEMWGYAGHSFLTDQKRWAVYRITIRQPWRNPNDEDKSEPLGRLMISANKTVLYNGPLLFEYETINGEKRLIPRMKLFPFANEQGNSSVRGNSDASRLIGPQRALDAQLNQFVWDMAENGSPTVAVPKGANLEGQGDGLEVEEGDSLVPNRRLRYDADAGAPTVIGGKVTHQDWDKFATGIVEHMQRTMAQSQLDMGMAASGAPAASAQQYIGQRLDETRKPLGQRWAERIQGIFSYLLEVVCAVYTDRRHFKIVDKMDNRAVRDFAGADLMGQFNVRVRVKPAHDTEAFQRANILETLPLGLIDITTPRQRLRVAKKLGIEDEIDAEPNQQIKDAGDEWINFTLADPPKRPIASKRLDNHPLHYQTHNEDLRSPAGEQLWRMKDFRELATEGWYDTFIGMMKAEARMKTAPAPEPRVLTDPMTGAPDLQAIRGQVETFVQEQKVKTDLQTKVPKNVQEKIQAITEKLIEKYLSEMPEPTMGDDLTDLMGLNEFLAHMEAHKYYEQEPQLQAQWAAEAQAQAAAAAGIVQPPMPMAPPQSAPAAPAGGPQA